MRDPYVAWLVGGAVCLVALVGCDSRVAQVRGTAAYDGTPIEEGSITFIPADGKGPAEGGFIKNGQYSAKSSVGAMKVVITGTKVIGRKKLYDTPNSPEMPVKDQMLPEKYADQGKTELTLQVTRGMNQKDWALEK